MVHREHAYDASDPYDLVAALYGEFQCVRCATRCFRLSEGSDDTTKVTYHEMGQNAKQAEWLVKPDGDHFAVLCPVCRDLTTVFQGGPHRDRTKRSPEPFWLFFLIAGFIAFSIAFSAIYAMLSIFGIKG